MLVEISVFIMTYWLPKPKATRLEITKKAAKPPTNAKTVSDKAKMIRLSRNKLNWLNFLLKAGNIIACERALMPPIKKKIKPVWKEP